MFSLHDAPLQRLSPGGTLSRPRLREGNHAIAELAVTSFDASVRCFHFDTVIVVYDQYLLVVQHLYALRLIAELQCRSVLACHTYGVAWFAIGERQHSEETADP
ncbi:hypothetical protein D3C78_786940 [compost metagenome]